MSNWLVTPGGFGSDSSADTANSRGTAVVGSASAHVKGSITQLVASTSHEWAGFLLHMQVSNIALLDIMTGASSSEVTILENYSMGDEVRNPTSYAIIPIRVPAGTRVSARCQAENASTTVYVNVIGLAQGLGNTTGSLIETWGADTSDSGGVLIDYGTTANTKTMTPAVMTSSCANPIKAMMFKPINLQGTVAATHDVLYDIMVGSSGNEVAVYENIGLHQNSSGDSWASGFYGWLPCDIPAGSRITIQAQGSITSASRTFEMVGYGLAA